MDRFYNRICLEAYSDNSYSNNLTSLIGKINERSYFQSVKRLFKNESDKMTIVPPERKKGPQDFRGITETLVISFLYGLDMTRFVEKTEKKNKITESKRIVVSFGMPANHDQYCTSAIKAASMDEQFDNHFWSDKLLNSCGFLPVEASLLRTTAAILQLNAPDIDEYSNSELEDAHVKFLCTPKNRWLGQKEFTHPLLLNQETGKLYKLATEKIGQSREFLANNRKMSTAICLALSLAIGVGIEGPPALVSETSANIPEFNTTEMIPSYSNDTSLQTETLSSDVVLSPPVISIHQRIKRDAMLYRYRTMELDMRNFKYNIPRFDERFSFADNEKKLLYEIRLQDYQRTKCNKMRLAIIKANDHIESLVNARRKKFGSATHFVYNKWSFSLPSYITHVPVSTEELDEFETSAQERNYLDFLENMRMIVKILEENTKNKNLDFVMNEKQEKSGVGTAELEPETKANLVKELYLTNLEDIKESETNEDEPGESAFSLNGMTYVMGGIMTTLGVASLNVAQKMANSF